MYLCFYCWSIAFWFVRVHTAFLNFNTFKSINTENYTVDEGKLSYNIDSVTVEQGYVTITGWAADVSESIQIANCAVLLREELSGEYYQIKTVSEYRAGISEALNTEQNIENCGFKAKTSLNHLNKNSTYEICVLYLHDDNSILCHTGQRMNVKGEVISEQDHKAIPEIYRPICVIIALQIIVHSFLGFYTYGDDVLMQEMLKNEDLLSFTLDWYNTWSSRVIINGIVVLLASVNVIAWKVLDIFLSY